MLRLLRWKSQPVDKKDTNKLHRLDEVSAMTGDRVNKFLVLQQAVRDVRWRLLGRSSLMRL